MAALAPLRSTAELWLNLHLKPCAGGRQQRPAASAPADSPVPPRPSLSFTLVSQARGRGEGRTLVHLPFLWNSHMMDLGSTPAGGAVHGQHRGWEGKQETVEGGGGGARTRRDRGLLDGLLEQHVQLRLLPLLRLLAQLRHGEEAAAEAQRGTTRTRRQSEQDGSRKGGGDAGGGWGGLECLEGGGKGGREVALRAMVGSVSASSRFSFWLLASTPDFTVFTYLQPAGRAVSRYESTACGRSGGCRMGAGSYCCTTLLLFLFFRPNVLSSAFCRFNTNARQPPPAQLPGFHRPSRGPGHLCHPSLSTPHS